MKFLIADDELDLLDLLELYLNENYQVEIFRADNGRFAVEMLNDQGPFDLVICDFNMPEKNGAEVYLHLRNLYPKTPFILTSSEVQKFKKLIPQPHRCDYLSKPYNDVDLTRKIENLLSQDQIEQQKESYLPVSLETLKRLESSGVSLYLKLGQNHYIKVLKDNALFDENEYQRFKKKNLTHLHIELMDYKPFVSQFRKNVFSKIEWKNISSDEAMQNLEADWSLICEGNRHFGWSETLMDYAKENIAKTMALAKTNEQLKKIFEKLNLRENKSYLIPHAYGLVFMTTSLLQKLKWDSESTVQKLTFACLFHDIDLTETMFTNKINLIRNEQLETEVRNQTNYQIYNHPLRAAEMMQKWSSCPPDVDRIIAQHHEQMDGSGFPHKLNFQTLFPLAGVFIISEDMIYQKFVSPDDSLADYLKSKESFYRRGDLKPIYDATLELAQEIESLSPGQST